MPEKVSIIITCYNYAQYLREAIDSALAQTYSNIEVIVVNDGSTDHTNDIATSYGHKIHFVNQDNKGVVVARNNGAAVATGDFLCFLDADDYLDEDYIAVLKDGLLLSSDETKFSFTDIVYIRANSSEKQQLPAYSRYRLAYENWIPVTALIEREAFVKVGGFSASMNLKYSFEDWDLWLKLLDAGYGGIKVTGSQLNYRLHGAGRNIGGELNRRSMLELVRSSHPELFGRIDIKVAILFYRTARKMQRVLTNRK